MADQYVWSPVYTDALIERDTPTQRVYALQNANFNVTSLVDTSGTVQERYDYDPFGAFTILAPNWTTRGTSNYGWVIFHQGGRYDFATGLFAFRRRDYSPILGRWMQLDPAGFKAGDDNLYRYLQDDPINRKDPSGLWEYRCRNLAGFGGGTVSVLGGLGGAQFVHCWLECGGHSFSLLNKPEGTAHPAVDDEDDRGKGQVMASGTDKGGMCSCIGKNFEGEKVDYDYDKSNCNSNWFAFSLLSCCVCNAERGGADYGYGNTKCTSFKFKCTAKGPNPFDPKRQGAAALK
jgi:RHS repeat-associated protein